ncbi:tandem-95 repeat protein [Pyruvatibacter mobilis]|uniref:tandem-95 repeat protein n=1 Tax=Pyruvatibacter mobilis TaxID=1712261 RepID=UPI003BAF8EFF
MSNKNWQDIIKISSSINDVRRSQIAESLDAISSTYLGQYILSAIEARGDGLDTIFFVNSEGDVQGPDLKGSYYSDGIGGILKDGLFADADGLEGVIHIDFGELPRERYFVLNDEGSRLIDSSGNYVLEQNSLAEIIFHELYHAADARFYDTDGNDNDLLSQIEADAVSFTNLFRQLYLGKNPRQRNYSPNDIDLSAEINARHDELMAEGNITVPPLGSAAGTALLLAINEAAAGGERLSAGGQLEWSEAGDVATFRASVRGPDGQQLSVEYTFIDENRNGRFETVVTRDGEGNAEVRKYDEALIADALDGLASVGDLDMVGARQLITGAQIGNIFGSALGNYLGDNDLERIAFSAGLGTLFESVGDVVDGLFAGEDLGEAIESGFADFGPRLGASIAQAGINFASSFIVGEIIGGEGLAADLGRTIGNEFVSSAVSQALGLEAFDATAEVVIGDFSFSPYSAVANFFGSQLASSLVQPDSQEAALVANVLGQVGSTIGNIILPVIGSFIGQFVGRVFGTLLGNALFGDRDYPRSIVTVAIDSNGRAYNAGNYQAFDGMDLTAIKPAADGLVEGINAVLERFGPTARLSTPWGYIAEIGYIAEDGYHGRNKGYTLSNGSFGTPGDQWNQAGFNNQDFNQLYKFLVMNVITNGGITGGDAWGSRVFHYGGWTTFEELMDQLQIAVDYRNYLENKHIIDRLITGAPDSAFAIGWLVTLGQAASLGFTNPDALHVRIEGTVNGETLSGTQYNDEIIAGDGNDALYSGAGRDLLNGGAGADHLDGGDNLDTASYRDSFAGVTVNLETGAASGGHASGDTLVSIERLFGSDHADNLTGDTGDNLLAGYIGNDVLSGGAGDDLIEGGAGADTLDGGDDYDIASYGGSQAGVYVTLQEGATAGTGQGGDAEGDTLTGFEAISGSQHSDYLVGNAEDNMLVGNDGNDFLEGGDGADRLLGGSGTDFAVYSGSGDAISINLETGDASGGQAEGDTLDSIENIIGTAHDDVIIGNGYGNIIEGGAGADTLDGGAGDDAISYAESDAGVSVNLVTNTVSGGHAEGDTISNFENVIGSNHDDVITVQIGSDTVVLAGDGDDIIRVEDGGTFTPGGSIKIDGGAGVDEADFAALSGGVNVYNLYNTAGFFFGYRWSTTHVNFGSDIYNVWANVAAGGVVNAADFSEATTDYEVGIHSVEVLTATRFDDIIDFDDDTNQQIGDLGFFAQAINAGDGNDIVRGKTGHDWFKGGAGNDMITGDLGNDIIYGGAGNDVIYGDGSEQVYSFAAESLFNFWDYGPANYQELVDRYSPYGANDRLDGGAGDDTLFGNFGDDVYVFGRGYGSDTIHDEANINGPSVIPPGGKFPLGPGAPIRTFAGNDTIEMASGLALDDLDFILDHGDLVIRIRGTHDQLTIKNWIDPNQRVETIRFADTGAVHTIAGLDQVALELSDYNSSLTPSWNTHTRVSTEFSSAWGVFTSVPHVMEDINGDGRQDLVRITSSQVTVGFGQKDGTLSPAVSYNHGFGSLAYQLVGHNGASYWSGRMGAAEFADLNGDGLADFVYYSNRLMVHYGQGDGSFGNAITLSEYGAQGRYTYLKVSDFDDDGHAEVYIAGAFQPRTDEEPEGRSYLFDNTSNGWTWSEQTGGVPSIDRLTTYADANNDGIADRFTFEADGVYAALGLGNGTFGTSAKIYGGAFGTAQGWGQFNSHPRYVADVNGDGYADIIGVASDGIYVSLAQPHRIIGTLYNDVVNGTASSEAIFGFDGNDTITAGSGDDFIEPGAGYDTVDGGLGADTVGYGSSLAGMTINLHAGNASNGATGETDALVSIENAEGSLHNDVIFSAAGANTINGNDGIDQVDYRYSSGAVQVDLAAGTASGGFAAGDVLTGIEHVHGSAFDDTLTGDDGHNVLWGYQGSNSLFGMGGDDSIIGGDGADQISGGDGNDTLHGGAGNDIINGGTGNDTLRGMAGADAMDGGDGFDTVSYEYASGGVTIDLETGEVAGVDAAGDTYASIEQFVGSAHADILSGDASGNFLHGGAGNDTLSGRGGDDVLRGGAGDDVIISGAGADTIDGGDGVDVADYSASAAGVTVNLAAGVASGGDAEGDALSGIENILGTDYNDTVFAGHSANNLSAGAGADTVSYAASDAGVTVSLATGSGSGGWADGDVLFDFETLEGSSHADTLYGDIGANTLRGLDGDDSLIGGAGNDDLTGGAGADSFRGGEGADKIDGGSGGDIAWYDDSAAGVTVDLGSTGPQAGGTAEGDELTGIENLAGSSHDDVLYGNDDANVIVGGAGADTIEGRGGDDTIYGGAGADSLDGGAGTDTVSYTSSDTAVTVDLALATAQSGGAAAGDTLAGFENLSGSAHDDLLQGTDGANTIEGGDGADTIHGRGGDDTLLGGAGNDTFIGSAGADVIDGGDGKDLADYSASADGVNVNLASGAATGGDAEGDQLSSIEDVRASDHDDEIHAGEAINDLDAGLGTDTVSYAASNAAVTVDLHSGIGTGGWAQGDTLSGFENAAGSAYGDTLTGDAGANTLDGRAGDDSLYGGDGDDTLIGGAGADAFFGGAGIDTVSYAGAATGVVVNIDVGSTLNGDAVGDTFDSIENLTGSAFGDQLWAGAGINHLQGGDGDDLLDGGTGMDILDGGAGSDWAWYQNRGGGVVVDLSTGTTGGWDTGDTLISIENVFGSAYDDTLIGNAEDNILEGAGGADVLDGGAGFDTASYANADAAVYIRTDGTAGLWGHSTGDTLVNIERIVGSAYDDSLYADIDGTVPVDATLEGGDGNDNLVSGTGADHLIGGAGQDWANYFYSTAGVAVDLAAGTASGGHAAGDTLTSIELLWGSNHDDVLTGDAGDNTLSGNDGNDILTGGAGNDTLEGGAGDDVLEGGAGADAFFGGTGTDTVSYASAATGVVVNIDVGSTLNGDAVGDTFDSIENLTGSAFGDQLWAGAGINHLQGGDGDDLLDGGTGMDILDGGAGSDWAWYQNRGGGVVVDLSTGTTGGWDTGDTLISIENVFGSAYDDTLIGNAEDNILEGAGGADVLDGGAGFDTASYANADAAVYIRTDGTAGLWGHSTGDTLVNIERIVGSAYDDSLYADIDGTVPVDATLEGGDGNDNLVSGTGADDLIGGAGRDWANYFYSTAGVAIDLAAGTASGGYAAGDTLTDIELLWGSNHDDVLTGDAGDNTLTGNDGNDVLRGGGGADHLDGGAGFDRLSYSDSDAAVTVDLINGAAHGGFGEGDTFVGIEGVVGSAFDDNLISNVAAETLDGGDGLDQANYQFSTSAVTVNLATGMGQGGFAAGDTLSNIEKVFGSAYDDVLTGDAGDNVLEGHTGNDVLNGGDGFDTASYASAAAAVFVNLETGVLTGAATGDTLTSIEGVIGSTHADLLEGDAADNLLQGGGGNDTLVGGAGADTLDGGTEHDTIRYDDSDAGVTIDFVSGTGTGGHAEGDVLTSIESVVGSTHDDTFYSSDTAEQLNGLGGFDIARYDQSAGAVTVDLNFGSGNTGTGVGGAAEGDTLTSIEGVVGSVFGDTLIGDDADNMLDGGSGNDDLRGGGGNDSLKGGDGDDSLTGGAGADWLVGGAGSDVLDGGDGFDTADYSQSDAGIAISLAGTAGTGGHAAGDVLSNVERVYGSDFDDQISGSAADDILHGEDGDDVINAGDGNDWVYGGAGADVLDGGLGSDGVDYAGSQVGVTVDLGLGTGQFGDADGDQLANFSKVAGSEFDDALTGSAGNDDIWGRDGNDTLIGAAGDDELYGGDGDDTLTGGLGADTLDGEAGVNTASYAYSADGVSVYLASGQAFGESGDQDDLINIQSVEGSNHSDILDGDGNANTLTGLDGNDVLQGFEGDDTLRGGDGSDWLIGGAGADTLDGGAGFDTADYASASGAVAVDLGTGLGTAGDAAGDTLSNIERLIGSAYDDTLAGNAQNDFLYGEAGNDQISGGGGNDWLYGGSGADTLNGGDGFDTVLYGASDAAVEIDLSAGTGLGGHAQGDTLTSVEQIEGSAFDDVIRGGAAAEALFGEDGNDLLSGGAGADQLHGGDGIDTVDYSAEAAGVDVSLADGQASDGGGAIDSLSSFENIVGSAHADTLKGDSAANIITAGDGDDVLLESSGNDDLQGGAGTDEVRLAGTRADYAVAMLANGKWTITHALTGDVTTLTDVEMAVFSDETVSLQNTAPSLDTPLSGLTTTEDTAFSFIVPATTFGNAEAAYGDSLSITATLSDGSPLPSWLSFDVSTGELSGTPANGDVGSLTIRIIATDSMGLTTSADMQLDVSNINDAPIVAASLADQGAEEAQAFSFTVPANTFLDVDADDSLSLSAMVSGGSALPVWLSFDALTGTFSGTPAAADVGDLSVDVTATDLSGATVTSTFVLSVSPPNQAPVISTIAETVDQGASVVVDLSAYVSDPEGHALSYALTTLPSVGTATLDGHLLSFDAPVDALGLHSIGFTATDAGGLAAAGTAEVTVEDINFAPTLSAASASVDEGQQVTIDLAAYASDIDGNALNYVLGTAPSTGTVSLDGSLLTYTSTVGGFGTVPVAFTVSDGAGGMSSGSVDVTVDNINFAPTAGAASYDVAWAGTTTIDLAPLVADVDGDVLSFGLSQGPAAGNASMTGSMLTFTSPAAVGANTVTYSVSDSAGGVAHNTITFVTQGLPNTAPNAVNDNLGERAIYYLIPNTDLLGNDTDPDGHSISISSFGGYSGSVTEVTTNGTNFTVAWADLYAAQSGSFTYTITDGHGGYATATANISRPYSAPISKPIVLDLDEDGIELVNADDADIFFDVNGDGQAERTGWAAADDGLLVFDKDMDDAATDIDEISFVSYKDGARTDLEGLRGFDSNGDGLLDTRDELFGQFKVWQDANQNGVSEAGELKTLLAAGIAAIELTSDETVRVVGDNVSFGIGDYHRIDGSTGTFSDTGFGGVGTSFDTSQLNGLDVGASDAGFGANHGTIRELQAGLNEVLSAGSLSGLLEGSGTESVTTLVLNNGVSGLVSAMASFDARAVGQSSINNRPEDQHSGLQLAAWVS